MDQYLWHPKSYNHHIIYHTAPKTLGLDSDDPWVRIRSSRRTRLEIHAIPEIFEGKVWIIFVDSMFEKYFNMNDF